MSEPKEMSTETRSLLAAGLAVLVIFLWALIYKPPAPPKPAAAAPSTSATQPAAPHPAVPASAPKSAQVKGHPAAHPALVSANEEESFVVESDLYQVQISNRGGVVHSWLLKRYKDDHNPPRTLDLVHPDASQQSGRWPLSIGLDDAQQEQAVNTGLYQVMSEGKPIQSGATVRAPADITLTWSDGHLQVTKQLKFDASYIVGLQVSASDDGMPLRPGIAWAGGFGDIAAFRAAAQTQVFTDLGGKISTLAAKNLGKPKENTTPATLAGTYDFAGIEDQYFAAAFLPPYNSHGNIELTPLSVTGWTFQHQSVNSEGKTETEVVPQVEIGLASAGPVNLRAYVGPKAIDTLKAVRPPLNGLVQFGWFGIIAEPLFYALLWLHKYVLNYGWDIVLLTIGINMVMFPLKVKSMRAMQKMQKVAPEIKSIQERYKKYTMRDPRKAEMNKEVMAVYSREGINPLGSCWPTLIQMPIWFALYRMLEFTIELRHAPWFGWIHDLSAHDPYFLLPALMTITMYFMQKMTPTPGMDPAQAKMMGLTPIVFGAMFAFYPSGLSLYILASNMVGMGQQWYLNRTAPPPPKPVRSAKKRAVPVKG